MTQEELIECQERLSKLHAGASEALAYNDKQRLNLIANLIADKIIEDQKNSEPLLRKSKNLKMKIWLELDYYLSRKPRLRYIRNR